MQLFVKSNKYLDLEQVQIEMLRLLGILDKVCVENSIPYWIDGGTLLGCVRHASFIPWDDDLDVCVLGCDYDRLRKLLAQYCINSKDSQLLYGNSKNSPLHWSEYLCSKKIFSVDIDKVIRPCRIDITPVVTVKKSNIDLFREETLNLKDLVLGYGKGPSTFSLYIPFNAKEEKKLIMSSLYESLGKMQIKNPNDSHLCYVFGDSHVNKIRQPFVFEDIFPIKKMKFGDKFVNTPNNHDSYLSKLYGDYLTPPVKNDQKPVRNSYKEFNDKKKTNKLINQYVNYTYASFYWKRIGLFPVYFFYYLIKSHGVFLAILGFLISIKMKIRKYLLGRFIIKNGLNIYLNACQVFRYKQKNRQKLFSSRMVF